MSFGNFLQVALRWRIEKEVIDGKGRKLILNHNHWWFWEFKVHLIFLKIHFENENFYFGNWNIISDIKIMLKIKISFNIWSAHWRNWDFHFGNHFEEVPFGDVNLDCRSQKSHFENFSWKLKFDLKVQKSYFGNHNLVLGNQKFHFDSQKVISKFSFSPLDVRRKNPIFCFGNQNLILLLQKSWILTFTFQAYSKRFIWNHRSIMTLISRHQFFLHQLADS